MTTDTTRHLLHSDLPLTLAEAGEGWPVLVLHGGADEAGPEGRWTVTDDVVSAEGLRGHSLDASGRVVSPWIAGVFATADAPDAEAPIMPYSDDATTRVGNVLPVNVATRSTTQGPTDAGGKNGAPPTRPQAVSGCRYSCIWVMLLLSIMHLKLSDTGSSLSRAGVKRNPASRPRPLEEHPMQKHPDLTDTALGGRNPALAEDKALLSGVVAAVQAAGDHMRSRFSYDSRPGSPEEVVAAIHANDAASLGMLREALAKIRPGADWDEHEEEGGALPAGEWWVTDPVEGNINHVHGMTDWGVTATLVRDNLPVLTAVHLPMTGDTYTAIRGGGAYLDGARLRPSVKTDLGAALVGTGQATPGEDGETYRRIGQSVTAMLGGALLVRVSVPATLPLLDVASGRTDVFWQYSRVRSGLVAGVLLVDEAGGTVTDTHGRPWSLTSDDFLATAPGLHNAAVDVLSAIS